MAGISVTLEGNNIQLAFEKNDNTTAIVMDPGTAQSLILALGQMLLKIDPEDDGEAFGEDEFLDLESPTIDVGTDERGQAVVALQSGPLPPLVLGRRRGSSYRPGASRHPELPARREDIARGSLIVRPAWDSTGAPAGNRARSPGRSARRYRGR